MDTFLERAVVRLGTLIVALVVPSPFAFDPGADPLHCLPQPGCKGKECCDFSHEKDIDFAIYQAELRAKLYTDPDNGIAARIRALASASHDFLEKGLDLDEKGNLDLRGFKGTDAERAAMRDKFERAAAAEMQDVVNDILGEAASQYTTDIAAEAKRLGATALNPSGSWSTNADTCTPFADAPDKDDADRSGGKVCSEVLDVQPIHEAFHAETCQIMKDGGAQAKLLLGLLGADLKTLAGTQQDERLAYTREALELRRRKDEAYKLCTVDKGKPDFENRKKKASDDYKRAQKAFDGMMKGVGVSGSSTPKKPPSKPSSTPSSSPSSAPPTPKPWWEQSGNTPSKPKSWWDK
ncbi:MAG: hypothetical protein U0359_26265 [Byssovorax sp.]